MSATTEMTMQKPSPMRLLLRVGGLVATLDLIFVFVFWMARGATWTGILQSISAGVLGAAAYRGGIPSALMGACLHYFIAACMVVTYYLVSRHWRVLVEYPYRFGMLYGVWLYVCMTYIVVPLSAAPPLSGEGPGWRWVVPSLLVHMLLVGVPSALAARKALSTER